MSQPSMKQPTPLRRMLRLAAWLLAAIVLALVFMAYLRPAFMLELANRYMLC